MSEGMPGLFSRMSLPNDLWDRIEALEKRVRKAEISHPGIAGTLEGQLAYWGFDGNLVTGADSGNDGIFIPIGGIILWSGSVASIPSGWALCDGSSGTPDLRGRFVVGAGGAHSPDDTGGADSVDISHTHGDGSYATDSDAHTHGNGSLATDSDAHTHTSGTYATDSDGHTHDVTGSSSTAGDHAHTSGSYAAASDAHTHTIAGNTRASAAGAVFYSTATATGSDAHTHDVSGSSSTTGDHSHTSGTYATDNDSHSHDVTGSSASDAHTHDVTGTTASDSHTHNVTGTSASGGDTTHDNRPAFYALAYIQRTG